jgi:anaerobic magnesium-protoporphyrin IX monomethyl ester cyclase
MRYNKILLIAPALYEGKYLSSVIPRAGLGYVAEALKVAGMDCNVLDMSLGYEYADIVKRIETFKPRLIGFTFMTLGYRNLYSLINKIKESFPNIAIAAGGPHISTLKEKVLAECPGLDYGLILEGEKSTVELCSGGNIEDIKGLIYRQGPGIKTNPFGDFITDLDNLSFPKYECFELDKYPVKQIGILTSRGCPYDCIYCPVIEAIGKKFRHRSARNVVAEVEYWYKRGYRELLILDDNFTLLRKRTVEICDLLKAGSFEGLSLKCPNGIRADKVDYELLKSMRSVGFDMLAFGVESASNKVLKCIKKGEGIEVIEQRIKEACSLGFDVDLFFIIGSPGETAQDINMSFDLALRYPVRSAKFYNIIPFPGTELYRTIEQTNSFLLPPQEFLNNASHFGSEPYFTTPELSGEERKQALAQGNKVTRIIRRRFIERKIRAPGFTKTVFSWILTEPLLDWALINNSFLIRIKEHFKKLIQGVNK